MNHGFITQKPCPSVLMCSRPKNKMHPRNCVSHYRKYGLLTQWRQCSHSFRSRISMDFMGVFWCFPRLFPDMFRHKWSDAHVVSFCPESSAHRKLPGLKARRMPEDLCVWMMDYVEIHLWRFVNIQNVDLYLDMPWDVTLFSNVLYTVYPKQIAIPKQTGVGRRRRQFFHVPRPSLFQYTLLPEVQPWEPNDHI